ncbi:hypothetical protein IWQ61_004680 [Dispira simplex]|nr:hypothetical protein IWQ61_004680 [Dispira simplex]
MNLKTALATLDDHPTLSEMGIMDSHTLPRSTNRNRLTLTTNPSLTNLGLSPKTTPTGDIFTDGESKTTKVSPGSGHSQTVPPTLLSPTIFGQHLPPFTLTSPGKESQLSQALTSVRRTTDKGSSVNDSADSEEEDYLETSNLRQRRKNDSGLMDLAQFLKDTEPPPGLDANPSHSKSLVKSKKSNVFGNLRGITNRLNFSRPQMRFRKDNSKPSSPLTPTFRNTDLVPPSPATLPYTRMESSPSTPQLRPIAKTAALGSRNSEHYLTTSASTLSTVPVPVPPSNKSLNGPLDTSRHNRSYSHSYGAGPVESYDSQDRDTALTRRPSAGRVLDMPLPERSLSVNEVAVIPVSKDQFSISTSPSKSTTSLTRSRTWKLSHSTRNDHKSSTDPGGTITPAAGKPSERIVYVRNFTKYDPSQNISQLLLPDFVEADEESEPSTTPAGVATGTDTTQSLQVPIPGRVKSSKQPLELPRIQSSHSNPGEGTKLRLSHDHSHSVSSPSSAHPDRLPAIPKRLSSVGGVSEMVPVHATRKTSNHSVTSGSGNFLSIPFLEEALARIPKLSRESNRNDDLQRQSSPSFEGLLQRVQNMAMGNHGSTAPQNITYDLVAVEEIVNQSARRKQQYRKQWQDVINQESRLVVWLKSQNALLIDNYSLGDMSCSSVKSHLVNASQSVDGISYPGTISSFRSKELLDQIFSRSLPSFAETKSDIREASLDSLVVSESDSFETAGSSSPTANSDSHLPLSISVGTSKSPQRLCSGSTGTDASAKPALPRRTVTPVKDWSGLPPPRNKNRPSKLRQSTSPIANHILQSPLDTTGGNSKGFKSSPTEAKSLLAQVGVTVNQDGKTVANSEFHQKSQLAQSPMPPLPPMKRSVPSVTTGSPDDSAHSSSARNVTLPSPSTGPSSIIHSSELGPSRISDVWVSNFSLDNIVHVTQPLTSSASNGGPSQLQSITSVLADNHDDSSSPRASSLDKASVYRTDISGDFGLNIDFESGLGFSPGLDTDSRKSSSP